MHTLLRMYECTIVHSYICVYVHWYTIMFNNLQWSLTWPHCPFSLSFATVILQWAWLISFITNRNGNQRPICFPTKGRTKLSVLWCVGLISCSVLSATSISWGSNTTDCTVSCGQGCMWWLWACVGGWEGINVCVMYVHSYSYFNICYTATVRSLFQCLCLVMRCTYVCKDTDVGTSY